MVGPYSEGLEDELGRGKIRGEIPYQHTDLLIFAHTSSRSLAGSWGVQGKRGLVGQW